MTVSKITYEQLFPLPQPFSNVRLSMEVIPEPHDNALFVYEILKDMVNGSFKKLFPQVEAPVPTDFNNGPQGVAHLPAYQNPIPIIDRSIERLEILIDDCKTMGDLNLLRSEHGVKIVSTSSLSTLFAKKLEELSK